MIDIDQMRSFLVSYGNAQFACGEHTGDVTSYDVLWEVEKYWFNQILSLVEANNQQEKDNE